MARRCPVTVTDPEGRRRSLDVLASSVYDAAHLWVMHPKGQALCGFPAPSLTTVFEVVTDGKIYPVPGEMLDVRVKCRRAEYRA